MKVLVTCPPMLGMKSQFLPLLENHGVDVTCPDVVQTLSVEQLVELVPEHDGWIIGDDPATAEVFHTGKAGRLKAAVKWGIGVDNVDFDACRNLGISITNTPGMFGDEVADIALHYVIALARETFAIDRGIRDGLWPKPAGISLRDKTAAVLGYGDIGSRTAARLQALGMQVIVFDPAVSSVEGAGIELATWPEKLGECDFIVLTCALNDSTRHILNRDALGICRPGVRVVNVARGPLIDEKALVEALEQGRVHSAALDVFEEEPLPGDSYLRSHPLCVLGSHNSSNTVDAVARTNLVAIERLLAFLDVT